MSAMAISLAVFGVVVALSALSLSTAVFLILELDQPFVGAIRISNAPYHVLVREIHR